MKKHLENHWLHLVVIFCNLLLATASVEKSTPNFHFHLLHVKKQQQKTTIKKISPYLLQEQSSKYSTKKVTSFFIHCSLGNWDGGKWDNFGQWQNMDESLSFPSYKAVPQRTRTMEAIFILGYLFLRLPVDYWWLVLWMKWN